jgi:hypothetical protein
VLAPLSVHLSAAPGDLMQRRRVGLLGQHPYYPIPSPLVTVNQDANRFGDVAGRNLPFTTDLRLASFGARARESLRWLALRGRQSSVRACPRRGADGRRDR